MRMHSPRQGGIEPLRPAGTQQHARTSPARPAPPAPRAVQLNIGVSAHQKLDLLSSLVRLLGFESVAVFGDCFDEVCGGGERAQLKAAE